MVQLCHMPRLSVVSFHQAVIMRTLFRRPSINSGVGDFSTAATLPPN